MNDLPLPFPSLKRFIPSICAYWNAVKGGSDTATKLMDDRSMRIPKAHVNTETVALARIIMLLFVTVHRMIQIETSKKDLNRYDSLFCYRNSAAKRTSFHQSLITCSKAFEYAIKEIKSGFSVLGTPNFRRTLPNCRRIDGVVPTSTTFGHNLPWRTPCRMTKKVKEGTAEDEVAEMIKYCFGIPMKCLPQNRNKCALCGNKTPWYCVGCKRWLCLERKDTENNKKPLNSTHMCAKVRRKISTKCVIIKYMKKCGMCLKKKRIQ